jgi:hypothetical protein
MENSAMNTAVMQSVLIAALQKSALILSGILGPRP